MSVVENGRLVAVEPDPGHPTGAAICAKARAAPELVHSSERLLYPMKRTAPKGAADPGWERIGWDDALDMVATKLKDIAEAAGPEAVAFSVTTPSGTAMSDGIQWVERLIRAFGSPNTVYGTEICNWHKDHATAYTFGAGVGAPDYENAGCIIHWGHNPNTSWLTHAERTTQAKKRGTRLVVIDPRRAGGAVKADQWLRVRPGFDGALALGIAGEMIANGWYDADFLTAWSTGPFLVRGDTGRFLRARDLAEGEGEAFVAWNADAEATVSVDGGGAVPGTALRGAFRIDTTDGQVDCKTAFELFAELAAQFTPERVEREAWVPAQQVTDTARLIWESRPVTYYAWSGVGQHTNATQTDRAISLLYALTGDFDAPGGNLLHAKVPMRDVSGKDLIAPAQKARGLEMAKRPLGPGLDGWVTSDAFYRAVLDSEPYRVDALVSFGTNMLSSHPNAACGRQALGRLGFHVHADLFMNPTAEYADIILPVCSAWEREGLRAGFEIDQSAEELVQLRQPVIEPLGESRPDVWIAFELARRLGLAEKFWGADMDAGLRAALEPSGIKLEQLRAHPEGVRRTLEPVYRKYAERKDGRPRGFATSSGRVEVYLETFLDAGQAPLPVFVPPEHAEKGPLVLTSAKSPLFCHGQFRQLPSLRKRQPHPMVEIHPDTAAARDIENGDWVEIETGAGTMRAVARFADGLDPRVVVAQQGWWQGCPELGLPGYPITPDGGSNYNALITADAADPISGSVPLRSSTCEVRPAR